MKINNMLQTFLLLLILVTTVFTNVGLEINKPTVLVVMGFIICAVGMGTEGVEL